ncbi:hypothetical protein [Aestuariispira insulae]|uniref:Uncharacterized protein n=1 Tax=Aestuariispira insulae TaxID=1461337 RepID=A0A3D9H4N3_9PROT|nr:hypothetical protein [Aestuariispira insulae]RED44131.1 hypothetical protein DFP90_11734 [Aestuariispira insulae]
MIANIIKPGDAIRLNNGKAGIVQAVRGPFNNRDGQSYYCVEYKIGPSTHFLSQLAVSGGELVFTGKNVKDKVAILPSKQNSSFSSKLIRTIKYWSL